MIRNNLVSLSIHVAVLLVSLLLIGATGVQGGFTVMIVGFAAVAYIGLSYASLISSASAGANLLSVISVSAIGLIIGLLCWFFPGQMGFNWMIYMGYHLYFFALFDAFDFDFRMRAMLPLFIAPSLLLWAGLQLKALRSRRPAIVRHGDMRE
ncbi:hypothetical protein [Paenibacillus methanolicus]|uniref:Uncharacterized protein n=1 Tax=Paenibacillus methanolicus TaxID=582686 RepID=A0A5S5C6D3_9BACL|nr:hypothetical protein [Paenibacillus methanolicus]TYP74867.1 hypothetical protein BCM02_105414 [Paenibacillus methanolicus]